MDMTEYLLTLIAEEAVEVAKRATKALRFGLEEVQPGQEETNAQRLAGEYIDLITAIRMLEEHTETALLPSGAARKAMIDAKIAKIKKFMEYSRQQGCLIDPF